MIGRKIRLLRTIGKYKAGSEGVIMGDCGCASNPKWVVRMGANSLTDIQIAQHNTPCYERWEYAHDLPRA